MICFLGDVGNVGVPAKVLGDDDTQVLHHLGGIEILTMKMVCARLGNGRLPFDSLLRLSSFGSSKCVLYGHCLN